MASFTRRCPATPTPLVKLTWIVLIGDDAERVETFDWPTPDPEKARLKLRIPKEVPIIVGM